MIQFDKLFDFQMGWGSHSVDHDVMEVEHDPNFKKKGAYCYIFPLNYDYGLSLLGNSFSNTILSNWVWLLG